MAAPPEQPSQLHHRVPVVPAQRQAPPEPPAPPPGPGRPGPAAPRWPWAAAGLAVGLLVGGGVGAAALSSTTVVAAPPVERTVTVTAPAPAPETITVPVPEPTAVVDPAAPLTTFGAGVWEVGVDVAPGKYKTTGTDSYGCYYARLKANDGALSDIISNGFAQGPVTVTVKQSDGYFETSGCLDWVRTG